MRTKLFFKLYFNLKFMILKVNHYPVCSMTFLFAYSQHMFFTKTKWGFSEWLNKRLREKMIFRNCISIWGSWSWKLIITEYVQYQELCKPSFYLYFRYKILFLDVLFPLDVKKFISVDADQVRLTLLLLVKRKKLYAYRHFRFKK